METISSPVGCAKLHEGVKIWMQGAWRASHRAWDKDQKMRRDYGSCVTGDWDGFTAARADAGQMVSRWREPKCERRGMNASVLE